MPDEKHDYNPETYAWANICVYLCRRLYISAAARAAGWRQRAYPQSFETPIWHVRLDPCECVRWSAGGRKIPVGQIRGHRHGADGLVYACHGRPENNSCPVGNGMSDSYICTNGNDSSVWQRSVAWGRRSTAQAVANTDASDWTAVRVQKELFGSTYVLLMISLFSRACFVLLTC